jgi:uncharacterized Zn-binding protein involved in type VI secretion
MALTIKVNGVTICHKGSDGKALTGPPDFCKTPPNGTPVPYVNVAYSKDLQNGSRTVSTDGEPAALKDSMFLPSYGDEPGTMGGVISGVNRGKAKFSNYSMDVFIEGRNVARLYDPMTMNGNGPNSTSPAELQRNLGLAYDSLCRVFCWCDAGKKSKDFVQPSDNC